MAPNAPLHPRVGPPPSSNHIVKARHGSSFNNSRNKSEPNNNQARTVPGEFTGTAAFDYVTFHGNDNVPSLASPVSSSDVEDDTSGEDLPDTIVANSNRPGVVPDRSPTTLHSAPPRPFHRQAPRRNFLHRHQPSPVYGRPRHPNMPSDIHPGRPSDMMYPINFRDVSTVSLASGHYTISQDHTAGEEARRSHLLANFGRKYQRQPVTLEAPVAQSNTSQAPRTDNSYGPLFDGGGMELINPLNMGDVLDDFDFDSFLHDQDEDNSAFNFAEAFPMGDEIGNK